MLQIGIVGKPNAGKSTLFNALTNQNVPAEDYPFCTIDKNVGTIAVPDNRLDTLAKIWQSAKKVYPAVTFVDIAGLIKGAHKGEGLGNMFLSHIREVHLILHLLNAYLPNSNPVDDFKEVELELILKDLQTVEKKLQTLPKEIRKNRQSKELQEFYTELQKIEKHLSEGKPAISFSCQSEEAEKQIKDLFLLTNKPQIIVLNTSDAKVTIPKELKDIASVYKTNTVLQLNVKQELELSRMSNNEREEFITDLGIEYKGLRYIAQTCYKLLNYITFYTGNKDIANAWQLINSSTILDAAGAIHTDLQKGFIKAEVAHYNDFIQYKGWAETKQAGKIQTVGKEYIMQDGDIILIHHN